MLIILSAMAFSSKVHSLNISLHKVKGIVRNRTQDCMLFSGSSNGICNISNLSYQEYYLSLSIVATIEAPWRGGLEIMGLVTSLSWLSALPATSALPQTWNMNFQWIWPHEAMRYYALYIRNLQKFRIPDWHRSRTNISFQWLKHECHAVTN
jgi:hypothetical protein